MPTLEQIDRRLWFAASHEAAVLGYAIAPSCEVHLRPFLTNGAVMLAKEQMLEQPEQIAIAEAGTRRFVGYMVVAARQMGFAELHEPTFFETLKRLCPLWPFC